jgi:Tetrahydrofolate dehydrogenase/cyclohydrolase, NAD(P)-binding domain
VVASGDVDFHQAVRVASALTPVPGGLDPMTIAALLHNTVRTAAVKMGLHNEGGGRSEKTSSARRSKKLA